MCNVDNLFVLGAFFYLLSEVYQCIFVLLLLLLLLLLCDRESI